MPRPPPLLKLALGAIDDLKGRAVDVLDVRRLTTIADHLVICTGTSNRHVSSIAENVIREAKAAGRRPLGVEGLKAGDWVLVDLGDVIVHVMQAQARAYYQLEKLWDAGPPPEPRKKKTKAKQFAKNSRAGSKPGANAKSKARAKAKSKTKTKSRTSTKTRTKTKTKSKAKSKARRKAAAPRSRSR